MVLAFMGVEGSFTEMATQEFIRNIPDGVAFAAVNAANVKKLLQEGGIELGVMPVYNSIGGPVKDFYTTFDDATEYEVLDQITLPIHHCLYTVNGIEKEQLKNVASHYQALLQTKNKRKKKYPFLKEVSAENTAVAAMQLSQGILSPDTAVICSRIAGEKNDLFLLEEGIEDGDSKTTFQLIRWLQ